MNLSLGFKMDITICDLRYSYSRQLSLFRNALLHVARGLAYFEHTLVRIVRISPMVLLIALTHRSNHAFNECNFVLCDAVLFVELSISPLLIHWQVRHELETLVVEMLRIFPQ